MNRTQGPGDGERHGTEQAVEVGGGQGERRRTAERAASHHASRPGYRPSVGQRGRRDHA